ncbi:adhesion G-protein coupled receptor G4 isoform X2 [Rhineura floridana]|nr:adhesion G-protein coupled receptor G4 isoform X2 [Rhineura floridana]
MFTVCIDLNKSEESIGSWTAFSYDVNSSFRHELALFADNHVLQMSLLGTLVELGGDFLASRMHQVCCVWDGNKDLLELFHNGKKMRTVILHNVTHKCLKPNGTLVIGQLHKNQDGYIIPLTSFSFVGILLYFEMWDHVLDQQQMDKCYSGNVVSWEGNYWSSNGARNDSACHQRCGSYKSTSVAPPLTSKAPDPSVTGTVVATQDPSADATTIPVGPPEMTTVKALVTSIPLTANSDADETVSSLTTPASAITRPDNGLPWISPEIVPSHESPLTTTTPSPDETISKGNPTTPKADEATSKPFLTTPASGRDGTTSKQELATSSFEPSGIISQAIPTHPTWSMTSSQYGGTIPKHTETVPTAEPTRVPTSDPTPSSTPQTTLQPDGTVSVPQRTDMKPTSESKATTLYISAKTTMQTSWPTSLPTTIMPVSGTAVATQDPSADATTFPVGPPEMTTVKALVTSIPLTANSDVDETVSSLTTPASAITRPDNGLPWISPEIVPSHESPLTTTTPSPDENISKGNPTTPKADEATSKPFLTTPVSGRDGTTRKQELATSSFEPSGIISQAIPTHPTWSMTSSQYGGTIPKHTETVPTAEPTRVPTSDPTPSSTPQTTLQPDGTVSVPQRTDMKPTSESKATTLYISAKTTMQTSWPTSLPTTIMPVSVTFYNIQMNFSVFSTHTHTEATQTIDYYDARKLSTNWLIQIFSNSEFIVTNHNIRINQQANIRRSGVQSRAGMAEKQASQSFSSKSIIKATSDRPKEEIMGKLRGTLSGVYTEELLTMAVEPNDVHVAYFDPKICPQRETQSLYKGTYRWPETIPADVAKLPCNRSIEKFASRECLINIEKGNSYWRRQNLTACPLLQDLPFNIIALENVNITEENAEDVVDRILFLLNASKLSKEEMKVLVTKLTDIANCEEISQRLATKMLQIIDIFMTWGTDIQDLQPEVNSILELLDQISFKMSFSGKNESIILPRLALALMRPDPLNFQGIAFGVTSYNSNMTPEIDIRSTPFKTALASIFLPELLSDYLGEQSFNPEDHTTIQFTFFGFTSLFQDSSVKNEDLITYVVGASVENVSVQNLDKPVNIILQHIKQKEADASVHCVFWDFTRNNHHGGWNKTGCQVQHTDPNYTICNCDHLTHFGVLLDVSRTSVSDADDKILTLVSYVGCGLSSIFLGLALVVYLSIDKLRGDYPSKILVNHCFALLMLNLTFLLNSWLATFHMHALCVTVAVVLHYFLLVTFTWMGLEAIHMYYALIKVFNTYVPRYMLKFFIAGWGIPMLIIATVLVISRDFYGAGSGSPFKLFCWIQDDRVFYISVLAYFCLVFLLNMATFIAVLVQIHTMKAKHPGQVDTWSHNLLHDLKRVASLMVLLSLTWGFAFFALEPLKSFFTYLFAICNTLQGFFIFIFHCLMKENVRKQCQMHFCWGKFRLSYSDWSSSASTLGYHQQHHSRNLERNPSPNSLKSNSLKSLRSCATSSTSNGSGNLPGISVDIHAETDQVSCSPSCESLTYQVKLPRVRKISSMDVELHYTQKDSFLP